MKKLLFLSIALVSLTSFVKDNPRVKHIPVSGTTTNGHDHGEWNAPADMPDVYYNEETNEIIIVDYASVTYYISIIDDWNITVFTTTVNNSGSFVLPTLSSGDYVIEITTSWNNQYEGTFTVP